MNATFLSSAVVSLPSVSFRQISKCIGWYRITLAERSVRYTSLKACFAEEDDAEKMRSRDLISREIPSIVHFAIFPMRASDLTLWEWAGPLCCRPYRKQPTNTLKPSQPIRGARLTSQHHEALNLFVSMTISFITSILNPVVSPFLMFPSTSTLQLLP